MADPSTKLPGDTLVFYVNGQKVEDAKPDPEMTLLTYLRTKLHLTGSKVGCGDGGCGACTVMVSKYSPQDDIINMNACLASVCSMHGLAVTSVEGIGNLSNIHPVQERIAKFHGTQCGFCTPGMVMSMYTLLRNNDMPTVEEMIEQIQGNLCRCTGYRPILDGFHTFTKEFKCGMGDQCCQRQRNDHSDDRHDNNKDSAYTPSAEHLGPRIDDLKPYEASQEPIFPPELKVSHGQYHQRSLKFCGPNLTWLRPATLSDLIDLKSMYPDAHLVAGNTELRFKIKSQNKKNLVLISTAAVPELTCVTINDTSVTCGAALTISELIEVLKGVINSVAEHKTRILSSAVEMLHWFACRQIKNIASLGGNIMAVGTLSDMKPLLLAAEATVNIQSKDRGLRTLKVDGDFFCDHGIAALAKDEVLINVIIPFTEKNEYFASFKQATRRGLDFAVVNAGMKVMLSESQTISKIILAFGRMGETVVQANKTMEALIGEQWNENMVQRACEFLAVDFPLSLGSAGGAMEYRCTLALSFFFKFYVMVNQQISRSGPIEELSAIQPMETRTRRSIQVVGATDSRLKSHDVIGKPIVHTSGLQQSTGEAVFVDDMLPLEGELYMALVTSTRPYAAILSIDPSEALAAPGVVDFVSATDIPGVNSLGMCMDTVFAVDEVTCQGQVIGAIVADSHSQANQAAKLVTVQYKDKSPVIITIKDAIEHNSFFEPARKIEIGNLKAGFSSADFILEGECRINGQNHFFLETQSSRAVPGENGEIQVFSATQDLNAMQGHVSKVLGVPKHKVVVRTKRLGGAFGGKETQSNCIAIPAAVAATKLRKPVRCALDRSVDMTATGHRHPYCAKYKVGFTKDGQITALDLELYSNGGNCVDFSIAIMERTMLTVDSIHYIPHMKIVGRACRTNIISNTAFRGFGAPQGSFIIESIIDDIAAYLTLDPLQVSTKNFHPKNSLTHFRMPAGGESVRRCWDMCLDKSNYSKRREEIDEYNRLHKWKKKGIAVTAVRFGVAFDVAFLNQAGALVNIYTDGTVLVAHGGTEMGQGLNVKVAQVASEVLEIPLSNVHISETATNTVPNGIATAASVSTDLNGIAVKKACEILKERLRPFAEAKPDASFEEIVTTAFMEKVSLSATGYYRIPDVGYDMETNTGIPHAYFTYGTACSEVQIDCLTGEHKLLRTDIVMDVGNSINPAVDVGQIEGSFIQGYGLYLMEDLKISPEGKNLSSGSGTYKIPCVGNIPAEFNVYLVPDSPNPAGIFASRGVGEPPFMLSLSAFFAVKDAIRAARKDMGESLKFQLNSPALPAHIRMTCLDSIAMKFPEADPKSYVS